VIRVFSFVFLGCLFLASCGYQVAGSGVALPEGVSRVQIVLFDNLTKEPYLDAIITDSMSYRLLRHHNVEIVDDIEMADAVVSGSVLQYSVTTSAYDAQDAIQSYRVTMKVAAALRRVSDGKIVWQGDAVRFQDFVSSGVDINAQEGLETGARKQVSQRLAEDISWQMASGFGSDL
jgi:hypothetical protein